MIELVDVGIPNMWHILRIGFKGHVSRCVERRKEEKKTKQQRYMVVELRHDGGNIRKKDARKAMCKDSTEENKKRYIYI